MNAKSKKKTPAEPAKKTKRKIKTSIRSIPPWTRFYYGAKMGYAFEAAPDVFIPLPAEGQVRQHLINLRMPKEQILDALCAIRTQNLVKWIGPVAGHKTGIHVSKDAGGKILVTEPPIIINARQGNFPLIDRILRGLFDDPEQPFQLMAVLCWLKQARENVKAGRRRPLPVLAIIGPRNSGKSLFLEIARVSLGGRAASAYRALTKENGFNAEILGAELLTMDDEVASKDPRARSNLAQSLKNALFASSMRIEGKNKDAFNIRPVHALAIALNDEPEHIRVLPERVESLGDKISLIKTGYANINSAECADREVFFERIMDEIPAFLYYLESLTTPKNLQDSRTGVGVFLHPDVLKSLEEISPEHRLFGLILQCSVIQESWRKEGFWVGTAAELDSILKNNLSTTAFEAKSLLSWNNSTGTYLGRLSKSKRYPVEHGSHQKGNQTWKIIDPDARVSSLSSPTGAMPSLTHSYDEDSFVGLPDVPGELEWDVSFSEDGAMEQVLYF
jgi:hypothetical protein